MERDHASGTAVGPSKAIRHISLSAAVLAGFVLLAGMAQAHDLDAKPTGKSAMARGMANAEMCADLVDTDAAAAWHWCNAALDRDRLTDIERAITLVNRSVLHMNRGEPAAALQDIDAALALEPGNGDTHYNRANALAMLGRLDEAIAGYDTALASATTMPDIVHYNRAMVLRRLGRDAEAGDCMDKARSAMRPGSPLKDRLASAE